MNRIAISMLDRLYNKNGLWPQGLLTCYVGKGRITPAILHSSCKTWQKDTGRFIVSPHSHSVCIVGGMGKGQKITTDSEVHVLISNHVPSLDI